ncbi:MAG: hypothetical protein ACR2IE_18370 [Candidatus Sumerlaeaceae bacterium]
MKLATREYLRQLLHLGSGAGAFLLFYWSRLTVAGLIASGVTIVLTTYWYVSKRQLVNPMYRPGESVWNNGAIRYAIGVALAVAVFPPHYAFIGWIILAAGDSASTIAGGVLPIRRLRNSHSVGGLIGFVLASFCATLPAWWWWNTGLSAGAPIRLGLVCVLCGLTELLVSKVDDNYYLPTLGAGLSALLAIS